MVLEPYRGTSRIYAFFRIRGEEEPLLHLVVRHVYPVQPWWLAPEKLSFVADDRECEINLMGRSVRSTQTLAASLMMEWFCIPVGDTEKPVVQAVIQAETVHMRCESQAGVHEREISPAELKQLNEVVWSWQVLGGAF